MKNIGSKARLEPVALITGGARGIGLAAGEALARLGYQVVLADLDQREAELAALRMPTKQSFGLRCDVTNEHDVEFAIETVKKTFGRLDTLVNNAGIVMPEKTQVVESSDFQKILDVHLGGTFRFCRAAYPLLLESQIASIVNVSSVSAQRTAPGRASYNSAKAAIEAFTRTIAVEWAPVGIRVTAVAPGFVLTDSARSVYDSGAADLEQRLNFIPMGRTGEPREIGETIAWLASKSASYITGQIIAVDGGFLVDGRTGGDGWAT